MVKDMNWAETETALHLLSFELSRCTEMINAAKKARTKDTVSLYAAKLRALCVEVGSHRYHLARYLHDCPRRP